MPLFHLTGLTIVRTLLPPLDRTNTCQPSAQMPYRYIYQIVPVLACLKIMILFLSQARAE